MRDTAADVPWRLIVAVRNRLIHGYLGIDDDTLWSIVNDDLVPLRAALARLLAGKSWRADRRQTGLAAFLAAAHGVRISGAGTAPRSTICSTVSAKIGPD